MRRAGDVTQQGQPTDAGDTVIHNGVSACCPCHGWTRASCSRSRRASTAYRAARKGADIEDAIFFGAPAIGVGYFAQLDSTRSALTVLGSA